MDFNEEYKEKRMTPQMIAIQVQPGWVCATDIALGVPYAIVDAIGDRTKDVWNDGLSNVTLHTMCKRWRFN